MKRFLLVDKSYLVVEALTSLLRERVPGAVVTGCCSTEEALQRLREQPADVVLTQFVPPTVNGLEVLRAARAARPDAVVIFLVDEQMVEPGTVQRALEAGASAVVGRNVNAERLLSILDVSAGGAVVVDVMAGGERQEVFGLGRPARPPVDEGERRILRLIAEGATTAEIGQVVSLSPHAVRKRLVRLYRKLGVRTRTEALAEALRRGLIDLPPGRASEGAAGGGRAAG